MFRKGLVAITSIVVISAFVACDKQSEQSSVSESVAEATEKQMQPVNETEAKNGEAPETDGEAPTNGKNGPEDAKKDENQDWPKTDASKIPSIDAKKLDAKPE